MRANHRYQSEGQKVVDWDGFDDAGRQFASGGYFLRMTAPQYSHTVKMTLLE